MEAVKLPGTDVYEVRFNGAPVLGCYHDTDCSGARVCAVNESWSAHPSQCTCESTLGYIGENCDVWGTGTYFLLVTQVISLIILLFACAGSIYCIIGLIRVREKISSNLAVAVMAISIASVEFTATIAVVLNNGLGYPRNFRLEMGSDKRFSDKIVKQQHLGSEHAIMLALAFTLTTVSMLFLSGVWASIAVKFNELSAARGKLVERICIFYLVFTAAVLIPTSLDQSLWVYNGYLVVGVAIILWIAFFIAGIKLRKLSLLVVKSQVADSESQTRSSARLLLHRIYIFSFALSFLSFVAIILLAIYGIGPTRRHTYIPPGFINAAREYGYRLATIVCAFTNAVVVLYLTLTVNSKLRSLKLSQQTSTSMIHSGKHTPPGPEIEKQIDA